MAAIFKISESDISTEPVLNASVGRVKTLAAVRSKEILNTMTPDGAMVRDFCNTVNSTGLYPYALDDIESCRYHARQFPAASGYLEDAATGVAAGALAMGLSSLGAIQPARFAVIQQGQAMGRPSEIFFKLSRQKTSTGAAAAVWTGGRVIHARTETLEMKPHGGAHSTI